MTAEPLPATLGFDVPTRYPITRAWAMPNAETFDVPPIAEFIHRWMRQPSVDPFARNSEIATHRNDLSPWTTAEHHMEAVEFCATLTEQGVRAELVLFDPPYSPRQISEVYQSIGRTATGAVVGPRIVCATHRRWLSVHVVTEWLNPDRIRALSEEDTLARRDEQDIEDRIDADGRLLPRGLR